MRNFYNSFQRPTQSTGIQIPRPLPSVETAATLPTVKDPRPTYAVRGIISERAVLAQALYIAQLEQ
eukprot:scaffold18874_cov189-Skeletonema_marinoi.AAC.7